MTEEQLKELKKLLSAMEMWKASGKALPIMPYDISLLREIVASHKK